jgi:hypothetical protein
MGKTNPLNAVWEMRKGKGKGKKNKKERRGINKDRHAQAISV